MGQKKLLRFAELLTFPNVLQNPAGIKGCWKGHFNNHNPITLELACGKGEYTLGLATLYPERNFIGVDQKGNRIWVGAKKALTQQLSNVAFLRIQIDQLTTFFDSGEVAQIWITFPDPQLRLSKDKKRLTHPKFLRLYQQVLIDGGSIHLKTDSPDLYLFTKRVIQVYGLQLTEDIDHVHSGKEVSAELAIKTHYEGLDIAGSNRIHYLSFSLPTRLPGIEQDAILHDELKHESTG